MDYILKPMRPTWVEIDVNSLKSNFLQVKRLVGDKVGIVSIVKADAYGHGSIAISRALVESDTDMLGVATVEEALEVRESGIKAPIVILGGVQPDEVETVTKNNLTPSLFSISVATAIDKYAQKARKRVQYHLKVDTGMNRLGVVPSDICAFLENLINLRNLELEGVFTHFANADGDSIDSAIKQIEDFNMMLSIINQAGFRPRYIHSANSAAIQRLPESHMNLVRPGIMLYGSGSMGDSELKPVMRLKTKIIQTKRIAVGTPVSYGGTFVASRPTIIATLPIGYADGYIRRLSNRAMVSIKGSTAPVVGTVCMDLTMIDVTDVADARVGDEVVVFGDARVSAEDVARWANTISYEVFSIIGRRVPRVYI